MQLLLLFELVFIKHHLIMFWIIGWWRIHEGFWTKINILWKREAWKWSYLAILCYFKPQISANFITINSIGYPLYKTFFWQKKTRIFDFGGFFFDLSLFFQRKLKSKSSQGSSPLKFLKKIRRSIYVKRIQDFHVLLHPTTFMHFGTP